MLLHVSVVLSFLLLSNIPLYGHTEICLYIHLWWIFRMSVWRFLWIRPLWTFFVCMFLCGYMGFLFFGYMFSLLSHMVIICLTIKNCKIILHCIILQSHQQSMKVFVASHVCLCLVLFRLFFRGGAAKCSLWDLISPSGILPGPR